MLWVHKKVRINGLTGEGGDGGTDEL